MKKEIIKAIRKIILWAFKNKVRVYQHNQFISDIEIVQSNSKVIDFYGKEIVYKLAEKLLEDGMIEVERKRNDEKMGEELRSKIYCLKLPN